MATTTASATCRRSRAEQLDLPVDTTAGNVPSASATGDAGRDWFLAHRPGWVAAGWWDAPLSESVRALLTLPLGLELAAALVTIGRVRVCAETHPRSYAGQRLGVAGHPCACQLVITAAWNALAGWAQHHADQAVVDAAGAFPVLADTPHSRMTLPGDDISTSGSVIVDPAVEEVAAALRVAPRAGATRLAGIRRTHALTPLWAAAGDGRLLPWQAQLVAADLRDQPHEIADAAAERLIELLDRRRRHGWRDQTTSELRAAVKRILSRLAGPPPQSEAEQHRGVWCHDNGDGSARLVADLTSTTAARIINRITALAAGLDDPGDTRTRDQKRADVLADLLLDTSTRSGTGPTASGSGSGAGEVAVVIDVATLLAADDNTLGSGAVMPGLGDIPADIARELAADSAWRAWLTTTTKDGHNRNVVATGTRTYRPSAALARLLRARDPYCRHPGCRGTRTDHDHMINYPEGPTSLNNLHPLCRRHHREKTFTGWTPRRLTSDDDDTTVIQWTGPSRITYTDDSDNHLP